ncbi:hypothetical protein FACS1894202_08900 [Clostridia bacterium]|nr:hypothetical protein FACS1894202_08900 [Clostridia bacterium]
MAGETWYSYSGYNKERIDVDNERIEISKAGDFVSDGTINQARNGTIKPLRQSAGKAVTLP